MPSFHAQIIIVAFVLAGGPAFNTQSNSDTSNTTRSLNTTTTNTTTTNTTTTNATFDLSINTNTGIISGLQARNLEARLNDKLAASGRTVTPGDLYAVTVRRGKYQDGVPYQVGQEIQPAGDGSVTHILEAFGVSAGGETINFKRVTDEALRKIESSAAEGENVAEVEGMGRGMENTPILINRSPLGNCRWRIKNILIQEFCLMVMDFRSSIRNSTRQSHQICIWKRIEFIS